MSTQASTSAEAGPPRNRLFEPPSDSESDSGIVGSSNGGGNTTTSPRRRAGKGKDTATNSDGDVKMEGTDATSTHENIYIDSEDEDSDPDDPVIKTLPVFLTPALAETLALIQYPHRPPAHHTAHPLLPPSLRPTDLDSDTRPAGEKISARYKPRVGQLELSVPLEVRAGLEEHRFNMARAKEFGRGVSKTDLGPTGTGSSVPSSSTHSSNNNGYETGSGEMLKRMTLSGETMPDQTWYACAVLKDNEVHLTPLTRTMQMRSSLNYLDEIDTIARTNMRKERARDAAGSDLDDGSGGESDYEDDATKSAAALAAKKAKRQAALDKKAKQEEMKAINVSVSVDGSGAAGQSGGGGGRGGEAKTARAATSMFGPMKAAQDEQWIDLPFFDPTSGQANGVYEKLFATKQDKLEMLTKPTQYLRF